MMKRVIALLLCLLMLVPVMASCAKKDEENEDLGAYINMYLTDQVYDLDPAKAYNNESALRVVSLLFDNLFVLDENGKVKKSLADSYEIREDDNLGEYEMIITLKDTSWTDGTPITANEIYYAWTRILQPDASFEAASLLFDIKNARAVKNGEGDFTIDDVGISALNEKQFQILFEEKIDYEQFLVKITSYALVPLREDVVAKNPDWAKKPATIYSSGPFRLREVVYEEKEVKNSDSTKSTLPKQLVLERNAYYYRDVDKSPAIDKSVKPYRIIVNYSMTDDEIMTAYNNGEIFFIGDIPLSVRNNVEVDEISDTMSTHTYFLNENAVIRKYTGAAALESLKSTKALTDWKNGKGLPKSPVEGVDGEKIFAKTEVRQALSMAINREEIAKRVVYAEAATALVPSGVFNAGSKKDTFRENGNNSIIASTAKLNEAKTLLSNANVNPGDYMFAISVAAYDDVHMAIAEEVCKAWNDLGFHVVIQAVDVINNTDYVASTKETPKDIMDDIFAEAYAEGLFEVAAIDYTALSADAFSVLAPFAKGYTGGACSTLTSRDFTVPTHITGYNSEAYNALIASADKQKDIDARAADLHKAEEQLLKDMPVIPIIYNKNASLTSKDLSKIQTTYYGTYIFTEAKLKNYEDYIPAEQ